VYIGILIVCVRHERPCLPSTQSLFTIHRVQLRYICFGLCLLILNVENTRKCYICVTILTEHRETNVCSGHRVRMCKVLCLNFIHTAFQVLGAILRMKRNRKICSAILLSPTCFLLNVLQFKRNKNNGFFTYTVTRKFHFLDPL